MFGRRRHRRRSDAATSAVIAHPPARAPACGIFACVVRRSEIYGMQNLVECSPDSLADDENNDDDAVKRKLRWLCVARRRCRRNSRRRFLLSPRGAVFPHYVRRRHRRRRSSSSSSTDTSPSWHCLRSATAKQTVFRIWRRMHEGPAAACWRSDVDDSQMLQLMTHLLLLLKRHSSSVEYVFDAPFRRLGDDLTDRMLHTTALRRLRARAFKSYVIQIHLYCEHFFNEHFKNNSRTDNEIQMHIDRQPRSKYFALEEAKFWKKSSVFYGLRPENLLIYIL
jgi:hypothetical protein